MIGSRRDFSSLSVHDLLEAREAYHVHLSQKANVVGTAIGRYRIRKKDPDAKMPKSDVVSSRLKRATPRTLENSCIRPWSWPCVLVFVDQWQTLSAFYERPEDAIPPFLYLPDGRQIPTCVIYTPLAQGPSDPVSTLHFSQGHLGGGYSVFSDTQKTERVGSIGCLVTDGDMVYALTASHVSGVPGTEMFTVLDGERISLGPSSSKRLR